MSNIKSWSTTPASNNSAPPQGAPEGMAPSTVNDIIRQQMSDHRTQWEDGQWFDYGFSISYTSATVLRFNQTSQAALTHANRRVKAGVGAGVIYGSILSTSVTSSDTVFTVTWDSGSADASLSYVELGIMTFTNSALPSAIPSYVTDTFLATEQASTSGTSIDFTGIPARVRRITVMFVGVSTNGNDATYIQIGDSGGIETSGYLSAQVGVTGAGSGSGASATAGFITNGSGGAASVVHGSITLSLENSSVFTWVMSGTLSRSDAVVVYYCAGSKSLSAELDRIRITTSGGVNTFDAGAINISYEF